MGSAASSKALIVLGSHRGGTSAITRVLSLCGAALPKRLLPPAPANEAGFWESSEIFSIHEELLVSAGSSWHDVSEFPRSWFSSDVAEAFRRRIVDALREDFGDVPLIVVKDPRISRLVPFWISALSDLGAVPLFVIIVRNPLEVAASLKARDGFPPAKSMLLWLRHFLSAERDTRGWKRSFVSYEGLIDNWRSVIARISRDLDLPWPRRSHAADAEIDAFLSARLRHHAISPEQVAVRPEIVSWVKRVFDWANRAAVGQPAESAELDGVYAALQEADLAFAPVVAGVELDLAKSSGEVLRLTDDVESLRASLQEKEGQVAQLAAERTRQEGEIGRLRQEIEGQWVSVREKEWQVESLRASLQENEGQVAQLQATVQAQQQAIEQKEREIYEITHSESLRFGLVCTWPLRKIWRLIRGPVSGTLPNPYDKARDNTLGSGSIGKLLLDLPKVFEPERIRKFFFDTKIFGLHTAVTMAGRKRGSLRDESLFSRWLEENTPQEEKLARQRSAQFPSTFTISVVVPTFNTQRQHLYAMIHSVLRQTYPHWELCIVDGASRETRIKKVLRRLARADRRIKVVFLQRNKGIAGNLNEAITLATGDFVLFLDHDDLLSPDALFELVNAVNENPQAVFLYSDHAVIDSEGVVRHIAFCPDFCRVYYLSHPYIVHLVAIRRDVLVKAEGFDERSFNEGVSHDVDLFLRIFAAWDDRAIVHIPKVLYFWRHHGTSAGRLHIDKVSRCTRTALGRYLASQGMEGTIEDGPTFNTFRVRPRIRGNPLVSIVIPTKDKWQLLARCLASIEEKAGHRNYEIMIVKNNTEDPEASRYLSYIGTRYRVIPYDGPFNFSAINNTAVAASRGELILFLNDDIEFTSPQWLTAMVELFAFKEVGVVGAKLLYPDGRIQHAGVIVGLQGVAEHWQKFADAYVTASNGVRLPNPGYLGSLVSIREYAAVTAACLMTRRSVFDKVGGFSEALKIGLNDVDFCLKVLSEGHRVLFTPYALALHHESASRREIADTDLFWHPEDTVLFKDRWKAFIAKGDPHFNPNLDDRSFKPSPKLLGE